MFPGSGIAHQDLFRRSEKRTPGLPNPEHSKWRSRPKEVERFQRYAHNLASWGGYGSNKYPKEILYAIKPPNEDHFDFNNSCNN